MTPQQRTAYVEYRKALRRGTLVRGNCERPGGPQWRCSDGVAHGHHTDYSQPLAVRWLCNSHHGLVHFYGDSL